MSYARKCDRCGKLYEENSIDRKFAVNEIEASQHLDYHFDYHFDLCPECYQHIEDFILSHENNRVTQRKNKKGKK